MKCSVAVLPRSIYIRSTLKKCGYPFGVSTNSSYIERVLTKKAYLVHISQDNAGEGGQILVLITL